MFHPFRRLVLASAVAAGVAASGGSASAQLPASPFRNVDPTALSLDRGGVWTLHFAYMPAADRQGHRHPGQGQADGLVHAVLRVQQDRPAADASCPSSNW